ncbi:unnamed protein product [Leptidea sinapis]|uniref:Uncharacterized protein n=1 Tax=Leptidea sinapis TaxID=189913 RepID=A0A5E4PM83_9NEOP|nr:unnamed protein product [Leptidea sinapis]
MTSSELESRNTVLPIEPGNIFPRCHRREY